MSLLERSQHSIGLRRTDFVWATLIAGTWTGLLALVSPTFYTGLDYPRFFEPFASFLRESLLRGELPWWNPYASLGRPFLADLQSAALYPTTLLHLAFGVTVGMAVATLLHGVLAVLGFVRLVRGHGADGGVIWVGATLLLFSAPWLARMQAGSINLVFGLCYLPLVLDLSRRLAQSPNRRTWTNLAAVWALQLLSSHPQSFWLSVVGASAYVLGFTLAGPWRSSVLALGRTLGLMATACVAALGLLGIVLVPLAGLIAESNRAEPSMEFSAMFALAPNQWFSLLLAPSHAFAANWEYDARLGFAGVTGGILALRQWRDPSTRGLIVMAGLGVLIAAGNSTPAFGLLYHTLPGFSGFRIPARAGVLIVVAFVVAATVLAGRSQAIESRPSRHPHVPFLVVSGGLLIALVTYFGPKASAVWLGGQLALLVGATWGWQRWLNARRVSGAIMLGTVVATELGLAVAGQKDLPAQPGQFTRYDVESTVVAAIEARGLDRQAAPPRVSIMPELIRENSGLIHRYATVTGFESLSLNRVWTYLHRAADADPDHAFNTTPSGSVYDAVAHQRSVALNVWLPPQAGILSVDQNPDPRVFVVGERQQVEHWSVAVERMIAGHPIHGVALVESGTVPQLELDPRATAGVAEITRFSLNEVDVAVQSPAPGILVLKEAWYPGWTATVEGIEQPCFPVNAWMRGVPVPAGASRVNLRFHQEGFPTGAGITLLTAALLAWVRWRRLESAETAA